MWNSRDIVSFAVFFCIFFINVAARRHMQMPMLLEEDGVRKTNRSAECQFGTQYRELGSTWFADLGPPFGVMYCLRCECVPVHKKRRIVARVQCKNIKNECPKPTCDDPILLPGRCCKTCAGDNTSLVQDVPQPSLTEEEERNIKQFAALLTLRTSHILKREDMNSMYSINNPQNIVATGRFMLHKKNLYFSFYLSDKATRPRTIQFMDRQGSIMEEQSLQLSANHPTSPYQNVTGKVCGVWRRLSRDYRRLLKEDKMIVVLQWGGPHQAELALAGKVEKFTSLSTEILSSLMEPSPGTDMEQMMGAGGTAVVSTIASGNTSSIHMTLLVSGVFGPEEIGDAHLNVRLEALDRKHIFLEEVQRVRKPAHDLNIIEFSSPVSQNDMRMLTRGKSLIIIESRKNPSLRIQGQIVTRVACEIFQTVLASHNPESVTRTNGLAWLYLNKEGALNYNVELNEINYEANPTLSLVDDSTGKRRIELEDLTMSLNRYSNEANGQLERVKLRVIEPLYAGDLLVNVMSNSDLVARGRLISRPVADARDSQAPILFKKADKYSAANVAGMVWLSVDSDCVLHYEVTMTGLHSQNLRFYMEEMPIEAPGAPINRKLLEEFSGNYLEGFQVDMANYELARLETHVVYLEVFSLDHKRPLLRAKLRNVKVPGNCVPMESNNELPGEMGDHNGVVGPATDNKCYHSDRFYDEGEQWPNSLQACTICSCNSRRVKCEPIKCPSLNCRQEDIRQRKGDCCPICMNPKTYEELETADKSGRGCNLGDHFYPVGYSWHPYLPPNGFDTCAICSCDFMSLKVNCRKTTCPPLTCSDDVAYRPSKKSCCKKCPDVDTKNTPSVHQVGEGVMKDQAPQTDAKQNNQEILATGGCKMAALIYLNGHEWHPTIGSLGEQKCIKCRCKDGLINCDRKRCTRSVCNIQQRLFSKRSKDGHQSEVDECCSTQCRRARRHNHSPRKGSRMAAAASEKEQQQHQRS